MVTKRSQQKHSPGKAIKVLIFIMLLSLVFVVFFQKLEFASSDLGRHLENGRLLFKQAEILNSNYYSYTQTQQPFVNHHWLAGLVYYLIYSLGGFSLLSFFSILLALGTFSLFFLLAKRRSDFTTASLLSLPVIFLLSTRIDPRPELFSYLFLAILWLVLESRKLNDRKRFFILLPLFIIWANTHIYFFLGLALLSFYTIDKLISLHAFPAKLDKKSLLIFWQRGHFYLISFFALVLACAFNPNHFKALFYPINILREYGYQVAENKSIFFLSNFNPNPNFLIFKLFLILLVFSQIANYYLLKKRLFADYLLTIFISILALLFSRNLAIFALCAFVLIAPSLKYASCALAYKIDSLIDDKRNFITWRSLVSYLFIALLLFILIFFISDFKGRQLFLQQEQGLGLSQNSLDVFKYYNEKELKGPIFNNYDAGSALIFGLSEERVFVDNRPEAYSVPFFSDTYIPMQEDISVWQEQLKIYNFKTIIFTHTDSTPWARVFMSNILQDEAWALIYFDSYYMVLINKSEYETDFIARQQITERDFKTRLRELSLHASLNAKYRLANLAQLGGYDYLAKEIYQAMLMRYPDNQRASFALAGIYFKSQDPKDLHKSLAYYNQGQKAGLKSATIFEQMAFIYWRLKDYTKAEECFIKAAKRGSKNARDYLHQIESLRDKNLLP